MNIREALRSRLQRWLPLIIVLVVFTSHTDSRVKTPFDSGWSIYQAMSLLQEGNLDLNEYRSLIEPGDYRIIEEDGNLYYRYPLGPSVVAAPILLVIKILSWDVLGISLPTFVERNSTERIERFTSSLLVGITALLVFWLARLNLGTSGSLFATFLFAFCTSAWSVVSRALWQHSPSILFTTAMVYCLVRGRDEPRFVPWAGVLAAASYIMRPTNALAVAVFLGYVAFAQRQALARYLAGSAAMAGLFFSVNLTAYGTLIPSYFQPGLDNFSLGRLLEGAAGTLISPGRGLFVYSPVLLFSLLGVAIKLRRREWAALDTAIVIVMVGHWLVVSSWVSWWGGTVYGPRLLSDLIPYFLYFLIPVLGELGRAAQQRRIALVTALTTALAATVAVSFSMHRVGARCWATWDWNVIPISVEEHPERLWDWHDPPFLRRDTHIHEPCS